MTTFGPPTPYTAEDLIDVLVRNMEPHWLAGLLEDPSSRSIFDGLVAVMLRAQDAIDENLSRIPFILTAPGPAPAQSVVRLQRPSGAALTIDTTRRFLDQRGAIWRPIADFAVAASGGAQTVDVPIRTDRVGHYFNSFEPLTYRILDALPDPAFVTVAGPDPAEFGTTPWLDLHGAERKVPRAAGENDSDYAHRMRVLEDMVSPVALTSAAWAVLDSFPSTRSIADLIVKYGLRILVEPFRDGAQPAQLGLWGIQPLFLDDGFLDDPLDSELRELRDSVCWFDVRLPTIIDPDDAREFFDDVDPDYGFFVDDPLLAYFDVPPGVGITAPIAALADELDRRRAGGVWFRIIVGEELILAKHAADFGGAIASASVNWTAAGDDAPADLRVATMSFDGDASYALSSSGTGPADDLRFSIPAPPAPLSVSYVALRAWVKKADIGAGTDPQFFFGIAPPTGVWTRVSGPTTVTWTDYEEQTLILQENPLTALPWTVADLTSGPFLFGVGHGPAATATEELRVTEVLIEVGLSYG